MWAQKEIILKNNKRGFHLITNKIVQNLPEIKTCPSMLNNVSNKKINQ